MANGQGEKSVKLHEINLRAQNQSSNALSSHITCECTQE